ncbi:MAG: ArsR family transcriptional regulator [Candidatus Marinimicrobia bacterium]|nr:ArsR family transcriptional regulator [Candidatus Neomarinimicrobiota bacterium]
MLESLITSKTKIKLLMKFFLNTNNHGYLRQLAKEFNESTNSIRLELNKLEEAKILKSQKVGRNKVYQANDAHPLFFDIRQIVLKSTGIDQVLSNIIDKLGEIHFAFIRGDYAVGKDSGLIDLVVVGKDINAAELERVRSKTEGLISRKINVLMLSLSEFDRLSANFNIEPKLVLLEKNDENL